MANYRDDTRPNLSTRIPHYYLSRSRGWVYFFTYAPPGGYESDEAADAATAEAAAWCKAEFGSEGAPLKASAAGYDWKVVGECNFAFTDQRKAALFKLRWC